MSRPATLTYSNAVSGQNYTFKVISVNHEASYTLSPTYRVVEFASVTARVQDGTAVLGTRTEADGNLDVDGLVPSSGTYAVEVENNSSALLVPLFTATTQRPQSRHANLDLELYDPAGTKVAEAKSTTARPESLSYPNAPAGNYSLRVISADWDTPTYTVTTGYTAVGHANLTFNLKSPAGTVVRRTTSSTGSAGFSYLTPSGGNYTLETVNNAPTAYSVPSFTNSWNLASSMRFEIKNATGTVVGQQQLRDQS